MKALTYAEKQVIQQLMEAGYKKAAQSFSSIVKQAITLDALCFEISDTSAKLPFSYREGNTTLVITDIMGEAGGRSYLLLSDQECSAIQEALPPISDASQRNMMQEAIIKEIDNILSAAVLTEFSNALDVHVFGGVPHLFTLPYMALKQKIQEDFSQADEGYYLMTHTRFLLENARLQPQFFWRLSSDFLRHLEHYVATTLTSR